jgi:hypothetical protein
MFFVLGDDNVLFTNWPLLRLEKFMKFLESHALSRFGMVLSPTKSLVTSARSRIEILGYQCNHGYPRRPIDKLVAQLVFPEHGFKPQYMSDRAVGLAYASAGSDSTFYSFCRMVYNHYLPYRVQISDPQERLRHLPGFFRALDLADVPNIDIFPTLTEIQNRYSHWQGELPQDKKWSPSHFLAQPGSKLSNSVTMYEYMSAHDITFPDIEDLFSEYSSYQHT